MINPIVRQLSIDIITDTPNEIINWFNDLCKNLHVVEADVYHRDGDEFIYYTIDGNLKKVIFFQDNNNNKFWCNYNLYWSILKLKYDLDYTDIQYITKTLVENTLNNSITRPSWMLKDSNDRVENALNNNVAIPVVIASMAIEHHPILC